MKLLLSISTLTLLSATLLFATPQDEDAKIQETIKLGDSSAKILLETLQSKMKEQLKDGDLMKTLHFCSDSAYNLTQEVSDKLPNGVTVKRISLKFRNPANAPKEDEAKVLESFEKLKNSNAELPKNFVEKVDANRYKYYKPLVINNDVCLKCHGKQSKDVEFKRALAERYPLDNAMGYEMGDVRGAVVVEVQY